MQSYRHPVYRLESGVATLTGPFLLKKWAFCRQFSPLRNRIFRSFEKKANLSFKSPSPKPHLSRTGSSLALPIDVVFVSSLLQLSQELSHWHFPKGFKVFRGAPSTVRNFMTSSGCPMKGGPSKKGKGTNRTGGNDNSEMNLGRESPVFSRVSGDLQPYETWKF